MNNQQNANAGKNAQQQLLTLLPQDERGEFIGTLGDAICHILLKADETKENLHTLKPMLCNLAYMHSCLTGAKKMIEQGLPHAA